MTRRLSVLVFPLLLLASNGYAWSEPEYFRGLKLGADLKQQAPECPLYHRWKQ
jgi:hypothetical protein